MFVVESGENNVANLSFEYDENGENNVANLSFEYDENLDEEFDEDK